MNANLIFCSENPLYNRNVTIICRKILRLNFRERIFNKRVKQMIEEGILMLGYFKMVQTLYIKKNQKNLCPRDLHQTFSKT